MILNFLTVVTFTKKKLSNENEECHLKGTKFSSEKIIEVKWAVKWKWNHDLLVCKTPELVALLSSSVPRNFPRRAESC